jgi:cell division control protein 6
MFHKKCRCESIHKITIKYISIVSFGICIISGGIMQSSLQQLFEEYLTKKSLFMNKDALTIKYDPSEIFHRDEQISVLAQIAAPALRGEKPSNVIIYGKTGTGKTVVTKHVCNQLNLTAESKGIPLRTIYVNCKMSKVADTEYRLFAFLASQMGKEVPATGLPTNEVYKTFFNALEDEKKVVLIVLDEIDSLVKKQGCDTLYNLTRINSELKDSKISFFGISNNITFTDNLDPRVKSSLSEEEIIFPPYDAVQLKDILSQRSKIAFMRGVVDSTVISKCAAYAAREHGDARRALDLLRVSGELAEREDIPKIEEAHVDLAERKVEMDKVVELVKKQPKQSLLVFYSVILTSKNRENPLFTGEVYDVYRGLCVSTNTKPLTQRRISDLIAELDMLGLLNAKVISKGRYGRTREITISISERLQSKVEEVVREAFEIQ